MRIGKNIRHKDDRMNSLYCRQPILYVKGKVLFKIIDLTGYILTFFLQGQSRLHLSVGFFWLLADSLLRLPIPEIKAKF